ncbi:hypothetical protein [Stenotrophomonas sp. VV52]|uniref:hypothetical protein n=1 Tax=Stenotrophomonas sp. VV52 TaxID=2066958 RepID=UPI0011AF788E|nr:hypothetical protein [Stenotrophomonas sp. VV52]
MAVLVGLVLWRQVPADQSGALGTADTRAQTSRAEVLPSAAPGPQRLQTSLAREHSVQEFHALKQRAEAGDRVAQRLLAETHADCYFVNEDRDAFISTMDMRKRGLSDKSQIGFLEQATRERIAKCDAGDGGGPLEPLLAGHWYAEAAKRGDLAARAMARAQVLKRYDPAETEQLLEEVLASGDPAAVFYFGATLREDAAVTPGEPAEALTTGALATWSWMVAACRMGYDCGPTGRVMVSSCLDTRRCFGEDMDTHVLTRELRTEAERRELERRVGEILGLIKGQ